MSRWVSRCCCRLGQNYTFVQLRLLTHFQNTLRIQCRLTTQIPHTYNDGAYPILRLGSARAVLSLFRGSHTRTLFQMRCRRFCAVFTKSREFMPPIALQNTSRNTFRINKGLDRYHLLRCCRCVLMRRNANSTDAYVPSVSIFASLSSKDGFFKFSEGSHTQTLFQMRCRRCCAVFTTIREIRTASREFMPPIAFQTTKRPGIGRQIPHC